MVQPDRRPGRPALATVPLADHDRMVVIRQMQRSTLFREYQQAFEATIGLPLVLREAGSFRAPLEGSSRVNPFCQLLTQSSATCTACLQFQQQIEAEATHAPKTMDCHAGLVETVVPVRAGGRVLGYLQTGQVLLHRPSRVRFGAAVRFFAGRMPVGAVAAWEAAYFKTRIIAPAKYRMIIRLLAVFAEHLGTISNRLMIGQTLTDTPLIQRLRAFIGEHHVEAIGLKETACAMHISPFHLCKIFRSVLGVTFTDYLARVRTEAVKDMLVDDDLRISEAAFAAGFQSLSQFNRVFLRIAGEAPHHYRDRLHGRKGKSRMPVVPILVPGFGASMPSRPRAALAVELYG